MISSFLLSVNVHDAYIVFSIFSQIYISCFTFIKSTSISISNTNNDKLSSLIWYNNHFSRLTKIIHIPVMLFNIYFNIFIRSITFFKKRNFCIGKRIIKIYSWNYTNRKIDWKKVEICKRDVTKPPVSNTKLFYERPLHLHRYKVSLNELRSEWIRALADRSEASRGRNRGWLRRNGRWITRIWIDRG